MIEVKKIDIKLESLSHSRFRASFHLNEKMKAYVREKGLAIIQRHAYEIISKRLKPAYPKNDGKQTPMRQVHPVFIAQHATGTCCRGCLSKWHGIKKGVELTDEEVVYIVNVIMRWIEKEARE